MASSTRPSRARPGTCQHDRVELTGGDLADAGVDVAADADQLDAETERGQLGDPTRGAGADPGADGQLAEGEPVAGHDHVARVLAQRHGGQGDAVGRRGRQVLERVHGQVDLAAQQRVAQRADEDAGAADAGPAAPW